MEPKRHPGRPKDEARAARRREEILDAAARHFAQGGYADTDVEKIAATLGVGKGTVYRHFPAKEELFLAAVDRFLLRLAGEIEARRAVPRDPLDLIAEVVRVYLAYFDAHPEFVELLILERAHFPHRRRSTYFQHLDAKIGPWRRLLRGLVRDGRLRPIPVDRIVDVFNDVLYGTIFTNVLAGRRKPLEAQASDILDIVFHGLLSNRERRRRSS